MSHGNDVFIVQSVLGIILGVLDCRLGELILNISATYSEYRVL
jgi:hypothetical protein